MKEKYNCKIRLFTQFIIFFSIFNFCFISNSTSQLPKIIGIPKAGYITGEIGDNICKFENFRLFNDVHNGTGQITMSYDGKVKVDFSAYNTSNSDNDFFWEIIMRSGDSYPGITFGYSKSYYDCCQLAGVKRDSFIICFDKTFPIYYKSYSKSALISGVFNGKISGSKLMRIGLDYDENKVYEVKNGKFEIEVELFPDTITNIITDNKYTGPIIDSITFPTCNNFDFKIESNLNQKKYLNPLYQGNLNLEINNNNYNISLNFIYIDSVTTLIYYNKYYNIQINFPSEFLLNNDSILDSSKYDIIVDAYNINKCKVDFKNISIHKKINNDSVYIWYLFEGMDTSECYLTPNNNLYHFYIKNFDFFASLDSQYIVNQLNSRNIDVLKENEDLSIENKLETIKNSLVLKKDSIYISHPDSSLMNLTVEQNAAVNKSINKQLKIRLQRRKINKNYIELKKNIDYVTDKSFFDEKSNKFEIDTLQLLKRFLYELQQNRSANAAEIKYVVDLFDIFNNLISEKYSNSIVDSLFMLQYYSFKRDILDVILIFNKDFLLSYNHAYPLNDIQINYKCCSYKKALFDEKTPIINQNYTSNLFPKLFVRAFKLVNNKQVYVNYLNATFFLEGHKKYPRLYKKNTTTTINDVFYYVLTLAPGKKHLYYMIDPKSNKKVSSENPANIVKDEQDQIYVDFNLIK